jgi:RNA polymerase sigma factor for flagellar operon FliA
MTNHVHLLQSLGRRYVGYFNPTYRRSGTLWEGRYGLRHLRESLAQSAHARDHASTVGDRVESFEGESSDPFEDFVSTIAGLGVGFLLDAGSFPDHHPAHDAYAEFEKVELGTTIASALEQLADRDRSIITLHYYHHMSFVDIASHLGVTKGRVSQLHKRILNQLRAMLHEKVVEEV